MEINTKNQYEKSILKIRSWKAIRNITTKNMKKKNNTNNQYGK